MQPSFFYEDQLLDSRNFIHGHPEGADSRDNARMIKLQHASGVFACVGPMCRWSMEVRGRDGNAGTPRTCTKWATDCSQLTRT